MATYELTMRVFLVDDGDGTADEKINALLDSWQKIPTPENVGWDNIYWWEIFE